MLTWLMVYLSNGLFPRRHISGYVTVGILCVVLVLWSSFKKKKAAINKRTALLAIIFLLLQGITILVNGAFPSVDFYLVGVIISACIFVSLIDFEVFIEDFRKGITVVCAVSVILYIIGLFTSIFARIPHALLQTTNSNETFTILWTFVIKIRTSLTYYRNFGIFSEPGQFQIFITFGLIIELFLREKPDLRRVALYAVTYLTCNSTNGFISGLIVFFAYISNKDNSSKAAKRMRHILLLATMYLIVALIYRGEDNTIVSEAIKKIQNLSSPYSYTDIGTGLERRRAIDVAFQMFAQNPITGLGYRGMERYIYDLSGSSFIMTFTPMNWFARFGLIYGIFANACFFYLFTTFGRTKISKVLLVCAALSMVSAQAVNADIFAWCLLFYGFNILNHSAFGRRRNSDGRTGKEPVNSKERIY